MSGFNIMPEDGRIMTAISVAVLVCVRFGYWVINGVWHE